MSVSERMNPTPSVGDQTLPISAPATRNLEPIEKKTYSLVRKIFEGLGLILMNLTVIGALANLEMLRGENSVLKEEYERVFLDKEITLIKGSLPNPGRRDAHGSRGSNSSQGLQDPDSQEGIPYLIPAHDNSGSGELTVKEQPLQPNPLVGQRVDFIPNNESDGVPFSLEITKLFIEITGEIPQVKDRLPIEGSENRPLLGEGTDLGERSVVPVTQSTGYFSRLGAMINSGLNMVMGDAPQPRLVAEGEFKASIGSTEYVFSIALNVPLTGEATPHELIEHAIMRQLPPGITQKDLPAIQYQGNDHKRGQIIPSEQVEELTDEEIVEGNRASIPRFIAPHHMQSSAMQSRAVEVTQGLVQLPTGKRSQNDLAMMAVRMASTAMLSKAIQFRLNNMAPLSNETRVDNAVTMFNAAPTTGTFAWLAKTTGMSTKLGFHPYGIGIGAVIATMAFLSMSGRAQTKSFVHRESAEDRQVTQVDPSTQNQGWLSWIYSILANTVSAVAKHVITQNTRRIAPQYSETYYGAGGSTMQFKLWETRNVGPMNFTRRTYFNPVVYAAMGGTSPLFRYKTRRYVNPGFKLVKENE